MKILDPLKAIRAKCIDCAGGSPKSVRYCPITNCKLWPYRFGIRPKTARKRFGDNALDPDCIPETDVPIESVGVSRVQVEK